MRQQRDETELEAKSSKTEKDVICIFCAGAQCSVTAHDVHGPFDCEQCGRYSVADRPPWTTTERRLISVYLQYERQRKRGQIPEITKENWRLLTRFGAAILARANIPP